MFSSLLERRGAGYGQALTILAALGVPMPEVKSHPTPES
jgi:hypothetical protein